jgi:hypothetical protein
MAREAYAYLSFIVSYYHELNDDDEVIFCQGNPFQHGGDFIEDIKSGKIIFGSKYSEDPGGWGKTHGLPMHSYCDVMGLPRQETYYFIPGAQFRVTIKQIRSRPSSFYVALLNLCQLPKPTKIAWVLERLWPLIFDIDLSE